MSGTKPNNEPRRRLLNLAILAALGGSALAPAPASAADLYWACGSAAWDSTCWSATAGGTPTLGQPQDGDSAFLTQSGAANLTVDFSNTAYPSAVLNSLIVDATGTGAMTLSQAADTLATRTEIIGLSGTGTFTQSGGTNTTSWLGLGENSGGNGTYNLNAGNLTVSEGEFIYGDSVFNQTGGTHAVGSYMSFNLYGNYNLSGGTFYSVSQYLLGAFTQSGGANTGAGIFINGTYNLSDSGNLSADILEVIGNNGSGTFTQSGGTHTANGTLIIGGHGGTGTYNLSAGNLTASSEIIGNNGSGTFTQSGGTHTVTGAITIAANSSSSGTYNLAGGALTAGAIVNNGTFNQSGGTTVTASVTNNGAYNASGPGAHTVAGDFTNSASGTVKTTDTTLTFTGTFTNLGAYISDPSDNHFTDLIVGTTGYLVGGAGDNFFVGNNFTNNSTNALWNTQNARLVFDTGADSLHDFTLGGRAATDAFSWGVIELAAGNTLNLFGMSFYVDTLVLGSGAGFNLDGATIYYRHLVNNGGSIAYSNGGQLLAWGGGSSIAAVPEPKTWAMLLAGMGLLGFTAQRRKRSAA